VSDKYKNVSFQFNLKDNALTFVSWEKTINDLNEEIRNSTLIAALGGIGALLCFAAAAFLPGGSKSFLLL
jgi:predicted hydrocarbon binding protein